MSYDKLMHTEKYNFFMALGAEAGSLKLNQYLKGRSIYWEIVENLKSKIREYYIEFNKRKKIGELYELLVKNGMYKNIQSCRVSFPIVVFSQGSGTFVGYKKLTRIKDIIEKVKK